MSFPTLQFSGAAAGTSGTLSTTGNFTATVVSNADGSVGGTWSFSGNYADMNPYYPDSGKETISGTLTGTGGAGGPWNITLAGGGVTSTGVTLSYANGQFSLSADAGFTTTYTAVTGYDAEYTFQDKYSFHASLAVAGALSGGTSGNDTISAAGNDTIDGGAGLDTVVFAGARSSYTVANSNGTWTVTNTANGATDTLTNVERLQFSDSKLALDISGDAGEAFRLYKAAFDRVPDLGGLGYQMNQLDQGFTLSQVANAFIASPEFQAKYGAVDDTAFITLLYENVLGREPEAAGLQFHLNELATGQSRADVLTHFSESPENQANVLGQIQNGMVYIF